MSEKSGAERIVDAPDGPRPVQHVTAEINRLRMEERAGLAACEAELQRIDRELDRLAEAICKGIDPLKVKDKINRLEARKIGLTAKPAQQSPAAGAHRQYPAGRS